MKSEKHHGAPPVPVAFMKDFFSFLDKMVLFLSSVDLCFFTVGFFLFFFLLDILLLLIFPMSKYFTISKELLLVNFVKYAMQTKYANNLKNKPQYERLL